MIDQSVVAAWDQAPAGRIHPTRRFGEAAYWESGRVQATELSMIIPKNARVLDYGCGDGRVAIPLAEMGFDMTGADSSATHLSRIGIDQMDLLLTDGLDLVEQLQGAQFEVVICLAVLIHYNYASAKTLLQVFSQVITPGGLLIVDLPASDMPSDTGGWIGVTTWNRAERDGYMFGLGFTPSPNMLPWPTYRRRG